MAMQCHECGAQLKDGAAFCASCGAQVVQQAQNVQQTQQFTSEAYVQPTPIVVTQYYGAPNGGQSGYDGTVFDTFLAMLGASIIMTITCGIATPWAICYLWKFIISHVTIDGRKLTFDGNGAQLFGNWIKWFLLIVITFGIYSFWVAPRLYHWVAKHTHFA